MPFNGSDDLILGMRNGVARRFVKASQTSEGAGTFHSLWKAAGGPVAGASPPAFGAGAGYVPTKATAGAFDFNNPSSPAITVLSLLKAKNTVPGELIIYDRLWACSGFSTVSTSAQSVTTPGVLPSGRDPQSGGDVTPWIEIYTAPGATGATWTVTGTDALGNTNRTWTYTHPANAESVGQMVQLLPGGGSPAATLGMQVPVSFTASISSGTAGDVGITLLREIGSVVNGVANLTAREDAFQLGLPQVFDDACLAMMIYCSAATTGLVQGNILLAQR